MSVQNCSERAERLNEVDKEIVQRLRLPVKGLLRVSKINGKYRYYIREDASDRFGRYVGKEDMKNAALLAQREFDLEVHRRICEERKLADEYQEAQNIWPWEAAAALLSPGKRALVSVPDSDEEYVKWWLSREHSELVCDTDSSGPLYSGGRDKMRSKSEIIMSKMLNERGIPYIYEMPLYLEPNHLFHPDFTLLRVRDRREIIWEHLGMMSQAEYRDSAFRKIRIYESNGYISGDNLLITFEADNYPLDLDAINLKLDRMFGPRPPK